MEIMIRFGVADDDLAKHRDDMFAVEAHEPIETEGRFGCEFEAQKMSRWFENAINFGERTVDIGDIADSKSDCTGIKMIAW